MAFVGVPVTNNYGTRQVRVTGLSLAAGQNGTIGNVGSGANYILPATFPALTVNCKVHVNFEGALAAHRVDVGHVAGPPILARLTNSDGVNATGNLEIFVEEVHSIVG